MLPVISLTSSDTLLHPRERLQSIMMSTICLCVCVSASVYVCVCPTGYLRNQLFCACDRSHSNRLSLACREWGYGSAQCERSVMYGYFVLTMT